MIPSQDITPAPPGRRSWGERHYCKGSGQGFNGFEDKYLNFAPGSPHALNAKIHKWVFPEDTVSGPAIKQTNADMKAESKDFAAMMKKIQKGSGSSAASTAAPVQSVYGGGYTAPAAGPKIRTGIGGTAIAV